MAVNHEAWRARWIKVLTDAKTIADIIFRIKNYRQTERGKAKSKKLSSKERKMLYNYIKQLRGCETEDFEIEDEPMSLEIANDTPLGYGKSTSKSSFWGVELNDSFEVPFPKINVNSAEKEDPQDNEKSVPLTDSDIVWMTPTQNKKEENDYSDSELFPFLTTFRVSSLN